MELILYKLDQEAVRSVGPRGSEIVPCHYGTQADFFFLKKSAKNKLGRWPGGPTDRTDSWLKNRKKETEQHLDLGAKQLQPELILFVGAWKNRFLNEAFFKP